MSGASAAARQPAVSTESSCRSLQLTAALELPDEDQNRINEASQLSSLGYGRYELKPANFSYGYDTWSVFAKTATGITESQKLPWEGARSFDAVAETYGVALRASTGEEFQFTKDGVTVLSKGKVLRVWRRVPPP